MAAGVLKEGKLEQEMVRLEAMTEYEKECDTCTYICGIDEADRRPLAGPVAAGAVVFPKECHVLYLNDSKKLSEKRHEKLFLEIKEKAIAWGVDLAFPAWIDEINILQATYKAMRETVKRLSVKLEVLLDDTVAIPGLEGVQAPITKGDAKNLSIVAASILAKVTRDHAIAKYEKLSPGYGSAKYKEYGMAAHIAAIKELEPCPVHRRSFIRDIVQADTCE